MSQIANYGFNTFVTENWLPLVEVLIDSILAFSKYPITVNCINFDYNFNNPRVTTKVVNLQHQSFDAVCSVKWSSLLDNPYDICAMLDADMIATVDIDELFETNTKVLSSDTPLFAKHPHNPFENPVHKDNIKFLCSVFSEYSPKMKWVYACGLVAQHHKNFIAELLESWSYYIGLYGCSPYIEDEGLLNALLTKYQVDTDIGYNYLPYFTLKSAYLQRTLENDPMLQEAYLKYDCGVKFYLLHGCKNVIDAKNIFLELERYTNEN